MRSSFERANVLVAGWIVACAPAALSAQSQTTVPLRGRIIDARTTAAVPGVVVVVTVGGDTIGRAQSDTSGAFVLSARRADGAIAHFARAGYRADSMRTDIALGSNPLRVAMTPTTNHTIASLGPTKVVAASGTTDFDRRAARHAGGVFITEADIARRGPVRTSDLFRSMLGVSTRDSGGVLQLTSNRTTASFSMPTTNAPARGSAAPATPRGTLPAFVPDDSSRGPSVDGRRCVLRIGVDGQLMDRSFSVDEIPVDAIRGIEAYIGAATIPIEFSTVRGDSPCGVVMIWTRIRPPRAP